MTRTPGKVLDHLILIAGVLFMMLPILLVVTTSSHSALTVATEGMQIWPGGELLDNYRVLAERRPLFSSGGTLYSMIWHSFIIAFGFALVSCLASVLAAYALVFLAWPGKSFVFGMILLSLWFPIETRFLPTFLVTAKLGLLNSLAGAILPLAATALGTFILRQSFLQMPRELREAARIDGAGPLRFLIDIVIPGSIPMLIALFLITFVAGWNQYLWPVIMTTEGTGLFTLMRGIREAGNLAGPLGMALALTALVPPAILVIVLQKYLVKGFSPVIH